MSGLVPIAAVIVDAHTFVHPDKDGFGVRFDATVEHLLRQLDTGPVAKAVVIPIACDVPYVKRTTNEFVSEICAEHADRLVGFASFHPLRDRPEDLERAVNGLGLRGLKLHPRFQAVAANDERVVPFVEAAAALGVPVAIDCQLWKPAPLRLQMPLLIDDLCKRAPKADIILCHAGGWRFLDALAVVKANDNAYVDVSLSLRYFAGTPYEDQFMWVLKQMGAARVIYGSDHPQDEMNECYSASHRLFVKHGFDDDGLARIFGGNIRGLVPALK